MGDDFPKRLFFFRSLKNLTQSSLANMVGLSSKQISDYEVGSSSPRRANFIKLLDALGVTESEFLSSDCQLESYLKKTDSLTHQIIKSGELINIVGMDADSTEINMYIYSGSIVRTKQKGGEGISEVFYLTASGEESILVKTETLDFILDHMKKTIT